MAAKERDDLAARLKAYEDAQKSEQQRQAEKVTELEAERLNWQREKREMSLRLAVFSAAPTMRIADADLALAALDRNRITFDSLGQPENLTEQLEALLEAKPLLKLPEAKPPEPDPKPKSPNTNSGTGADDGPPPSLSSEELEAAKESEMDPERYAKLKDVKSFDDWKALQQKASV